MKFCLENQGPSLSDIFSRFITFQIYLTFLNGCDKNLIKVYDFSIKNIKLRQLDLGVS